MTIEIGKNITYKLNIETYSIPGQQENKIRRGKDIIMIYGIEDLGWTLSTLKEWGYFLFYLFLFYYKDKFKLLNHQETLSTYIYKYIYGYIIYSTSDNFVP